MADYIERDALTAELNRLGLGEYSFVERIFADGVYAVIESMPAADVAPVVRCKECTNFRQNAHGVCYCNEYGGAITPEDYCSRSVRENEPPAK